MKLQKIEPTKMKRINFKKLVMRLSISVVIFSLILYTVSAHPGKIDSKGGHTCKTNCEKWGLDDGEYHYHNSVSNNDITTTKNTTTPKPTPVQTKQPASTKTPKSAKIPATTVSSPEPTVYVPFDRLATVTSITDGDTVYVDFKEKVRFVGVNTPEIGTEGAEEAKNYIANRIKDKQVYLDVDNKNLKDKYGRTLAVIYINGDNLNKELLCKGYADVMYIPPSEFYPYDWQTSCSNSSALPAITTTASSDAQLNQEIAESKERLNQTDETINQQKKKISWLEEMINSLLRSFK